MKDIEFTSFIPVCLISLCVLVLCSWQIRMTLTLGATQVRTIENQKPAVERSLKIQEEARALLEDLLEVAKVDEQAAAVCLKYQIRRNE